MVGGRKNRRPTDLNETDLAQERMSRNSLQADDQDDVRNQRHSMPESKRDPDDGVRESVRKMDKDVRARADLNNGATRRRD